MSRSAPFAAACAFVWVCGTAALTRAAESQPPKVELSLNIYVALFNGEEQPKDGPTLMLDLVKEGDRWGRVLGIARNFCASLHSGRVVEGKIADPGIEISLEMDIRGDGWVKGGRAAYQVSLKKIAGGAYEGTYTGRWKTVTVRGRADAAIKPPAKTFAGIAPVKAGEHPRILFRKGELPALRDRAKTPFGQAALAKMPAGPEDAIGLAMKYQLTGEASFAGQAMAAADKLMAAGQRSDQYGHNLGARAQNVGIAYDLCYDVWPVEYKRKVESYVIWAAQFPFFNQSMGGGGVNWHVVSNWSAPIYTGIGFAALATWGEKGPPPVKPVAPCLTGQIPAAKDWTPGKGAPVCQFVPGQTPPRWLVTPVMDVIVHGDPLESLGGCSQARPELGTAFTVEGKALEFLALPEGVATDVGGFNLAKLLPRTENQRSTVCFFTVIDNAEPRVVKARVPVGRSGRSEMFLNGAPLFHQQVVRLDKGLYPMLVTLRVETLWDTLETWLDPATDGELQQSVAKNAALQADYEQRLKDWQFDLDEWKRLGGANLALQQVFELSRKMVYMHYREAVGTGGFQGESGHYSHIATGAAAPYATAYRLMFGEDVSPYADITHYLPRKMFAHAYPPDGKAFGQETHGTIEIDGRDFASLFTVAPDPWKPAVLWGWNYHVGAADKESLKKIVEAAPVWGFLYYPLGVEPKPPQGLLPLTWEAPDFGYYGFRNAWRGKDDFIVQTYLKSHFIGGWNVPSAGCFRLMGLGHLWAHHPSGRNYARAQENVVLLPENPEINENEGVRLTYLKTEPDGSGSLTMDMNELYASTHTAEKGSKERAIAYHELYGNIRHPAALKDVGIKGLRAMAVDYSGRCGAPCLFVLVDRIAGGKKKLWLWQLGDTLDKTRVAGNVFTIHQGDANLRGTFIAPSAVKLEAKSQAAGGGKSATPVSALFAGRADGQGGDFFVVVTVQRGEAPAVHVEGAGLNARITVGQVKVSFDGQKIVLDRP